MALPISAAAAQAREATITAGRPRHNWASGRKNRIDHLRSGRNHARFRLAARMIEGGFRRSRPSA